MRRALAPIEAWPGDFTGDGDLDIVVIARGAAFDNTVIDLFIGDRHRRSRHAAWHARRRHPVRAGGDRVSGGGGDDALDCGTGADRCGGGPGTDSVANCEVASAIP